MKQLGRYQVIKQIGQGGMAKALLAEAPGGQRVVLKLPTIDNQEANERLRNEARVGVRLDHEGLVQTLDLFEFEGAPVLVVAFIDGRSLFDVLQDGRLATPAVATLGKRLAGALKAIHNCSDEAGQALHMLHRDVTPGNVLIDRQGNAKLIDLGIARSAEALLRTQTGTLLGTLPYLAPELFDEASYSPATDLWALGCLLFEAAAGQRLYAGSEAQIVRKLIQQQPWDHPAWSSLEPTVSDVLRLFLEKDPAARIHDAARAEELLLDLETRFPGGVRQLSERVGEGSADDDEGGAPTAVQTRNLYFPEDRQYEVDKHRLSTTRKWESKASLSEVRTPRPITMAGLFAGATEPLLKPPPSRSDAAIEATAGEPMLAQKPSAEVLSGPKPEFAPLALGQELSDPDEGEFISIEELRIVPGAPLPEHLPVHPSSMGAASQPERAAIAGAPAAAPGAGGHRFAPPPPEPDLELDDHDRGRRQIATPRESMASDGYYPEVPPKRSGPSPAVVGLAVMGVLALLIAAMALRVDKMVGVDVVKLVNGDAGKPTPSRRSPLPLPTVDDRVDAPECFTTNDGFFFIYTDAGGVSVVKEAIEDVPRRFRRRARCVPADSK